MATAVRAREPSPRFLAVGPVLADSGPLLALFNASDAWHTPVRGWLKARPQVQLVTTWPVATKVCALLARRIGNPAALDFLRWAQRGGIRLDMPEVGSFAEVLAQVLAVRERFRDLPFDLADASVAEAASRLRIRHVLTIDAYFDIYRDKAGQALVNVLRQPG
jgi:predicted nucleic acid-binding protein